VEINAHGYTKVDERRQTTAANIWAAGDCAGSPQFTPGASDDFRIVYDNPTMSEGLNVLLASVPAKSPRRSA
jgi:pyruvate/2-oxoglutarate dehydrogenase complex dihydrolipoamide dehydrogenase (E3) component